MRTVRTTAHAAQAAPEDRSARRAMVAGLAFFLTLSAGPAAAAAPAEDPRSPQPGRNGTAAVSIDRTAVAGPWLPDLDALFPRVPVAVTTPTERSARQPVPQRFRMNLFRKGDFASQLTSYWCIPASTQMMMNMMDSGKANRSRAVQRRLYRIGDRLEEDGTFSPDPEPDRWRGMGISEWVGLLNRYDYGPYELGGSRSFRKTLKQAARMMRETGKPVGLVVWRGAHAWVMSGFVATADPATTNDFEVTQVWVQDPWYPRTSSIWGKSRGPNAKVSPQVLREDFKRYGRPGRRNPERDGRYMLVLPRPERTELAPAA